MPPHTLRAREQAAPRRVRLRRLLTSRPERAPRPRAALPFGMLGALGLIVLAESFVARHPIEFSEPVRLSWHDTAAVTHRVAPGRDVLFFGDSLVKYDLAPRVFTAKSGLSAYNLAVARACPPLTYFLLRRALDAGARPKAVIVDFKPVMLLLGVDVFGPSTWQDSLTPKECVELARAEGSAFLLGRLLVGRLLPSVRSRLEVRQNLAVALRGEVPWGSLGNRLVRRNWAVNAGAHVAPRSPTFPGEMTPLDVGKMRPDEWSFHPINLTFIERFFALAAERQIPVYWLLPPSPPQLIARRERSGAEARYLELVHSVRNRFPNVTVLDARHSGYDHTRFTDISHLHREGALALSRDVADVLRRDLGGGSAPSPRWVALPTYRPEPDEGRVEDTDESRAAVLNPSPTRGPAL